MLWLMLVLAAAGAALLFGGPWMARRLAHVREDPVDPVALARLLQLAGVILLALALLARPGDGGLSAFPPPPGAADG